MSSGIAEAGMRASGADKPVPLPVQALDHATGYLMAALAIRAVTRRSTAGIATTARLSLARTAQLLPPSARADDAGAGPGRDTTIAESEADAVAEVENTPWGPARRIRPPVFVGHAPLRWDRAACELRSAQPAWRARRESNPHLRV